MKVLPKDTPNTPQFIWRICSIGQKIWNKLAKALNGCPQSVCLLLLNSIVLPGLVKNQLSQQKKRTLRPLKNVQKVLWWFQRFFAYHQTTERMFLLQVSSLLFLLYLNKLNTVFPQIVSSLEQFPPFNSFRGNYSIFEVKNYHNYAHFGTW